jgi:hypothetical protein
MLPHPASPDGPVRNLEARAECRANGWLWLSWRLDGDLSLLRLPAVTASVRADGLWRHTCFEAFLAGTQGPAYCELNFSPSGEWSAYRFSSYRTGMTPLDLPSAPDIRWRRNTERLALDVALRVRDLVSGTPRPALRIGFSAVIEGQSGTITHWALLHPEGGPDFHHAKSFALELAMPQADEGGTDGP